MTVAGAGPPCPGARRSSASARDTPDPARPAGPRPIGSLTSAARRPRRTWRRTLLGAATASQPPLNTKPGPERLTTRHKWRGEGETLSASSSDPNSPPRPPAAGPGESGRLNRQQRVPAAMRLTAREFIWLVAAGAAGLLLYWVLAWNGARPTTTRRWRFWWPWPSRAALPAHADPAVQDRHRHRGLLHLPAPLRPSGGDGPGRRQSGHRAADAGPQTPAADRAPPPLPSVASAPSPASASWSSTPPA